MSSGAANERSRGALGQGLEDRGVIVTGSASAIGRATVEAFAAADAGFVVLDSNAQGAAATIVVVGANRA